jgi:xylan 1,4-beta-xylosidase
MLISEAKIKRYFGLALWLVLAAFQAGAQETYTNPVIPGDFPDPSVIRVGADYYATATTGGWAPSFPILHSRDLVNWQIVGAVFENKPAWAKGDFWAPELVVDRGRFFVYYTARRAEGPNKKGTLCVAVATAAKPDGIWRDRGPLVCQEMGSIDADFERDEKGRPFLIWKEDGNDRRQPTWLYAQRLDKSGTRLLGEPVRLFRNTEAWENHVVEGSFILRRGGWFYMFYSGNACCGRSCDYALGVARAKRLLGPWEKNPANPILKKNENWRCPGHGSIVTTADNRDFLLYHAYRNNSTGFNIGREALLDEVKFENEWPTINGGRGASGKAAAPFEATRQQSAFSFLSDEFGASTLAPRWSQTLFNYGTARLADGFLSLAPQAKQLADERMPELVVAERTVSGNYRATTRVEISKLKPPESAGLSVYSWRGNATGISAGGGRIFVWRRENGRQEDLSSVPLPAARSAIFYKISAADGEKFRFSYSFDGRNWENLGETVNAGYIEGARVALIYNGPTAAAGARFDWIRVEPD